MLRWKFLSILRLFSTLHVIRLTGTECLCLLYEAFILFLIISLLEIVVLSQGGGGSSVKRYKCVLKSQKKKASKNIQVCNILSVNQLFLNKLTLTGEFWIYPNISFPDCEWCDELYLW